MCSSDLVAMRTICSGSSSKGDMLVTKSLGTTVCESGALWVYSGTGEGALANSFSMSHKAELSRRGAGDAGGVISIV